MEEFTLNQLDDLKLNMIDYKWLQNCNKVPHLKRALQILKEQGSGSSDLAKQIQEKLESLDPTAKQTPLYPLYQQCRKPKSKVSELYMKKIKEKALKEKEKGNKAMKQKKYEAARMYYTESINLYEDPKVYSNRAAACYNMKLYEQCIEDSNMAIKMDKTFLKPYNRRGQAHYALQNYKEAISDYEFILSHDEYKNNKKLNKLLDKYKKEFEKQNKKNQTQQSKKQKIDKPPVEEEEKQQNQAEKIEQPKVMKWAEAPKVVVKEKPTNPKIIKVLNKVKKIKEKGVKQLKKGMYEIAITKYQNAVSLIDKYFDKNGEEGEDIKFLKFQKAGCLNNIALCYKNMQQPDKTIYYASLALNLGVDNRNLKIKAHLRRGYAFEEKDKLGHAKKDYVAIKMLDPGNMNASRGLGRISSAIYEKKREREEYDRLQEGKYKKPAAESRMSQLKNKYDDDGKLKDNSQKPKSSSQKPQYKRSSEVIKMQIKQLGKMKDIGNSKFKEKQFQEAIDQFEKTVKYLHTQFDEDTIDENEGLKDILISCYSNKAICYLRINQFYFAIKTCNFVLNKDENNQKAFYRRGLGYVGLSDQSKNVQKLSVAKKQMELLEKARKDFKQFLEKDPHNKTVKKQLKACDKKILNAVKIFNKLKKQGNYE